MDFIDQMRALAERIPRQLEHLHTEEATKNAFVMPFLNILGYNVFDPFEVVPEFTADVGGKKGEKVDYAIHLDGKLTILVECKHSGRGLHRNDASQLYRYFSVTEARIALLTNGVVYRFYSDLDRPNIMDERPSLEINLLSLQEPLVRELKKLTKSSFDLDNILSTASDLKYSGEIKRILAQQLDAPDEEFVRFFAKQVYVGKLTQPMRDQFTPIVRAAFQHFIADQLTQRLKTALNAEVAITDAPRATEAAAEVGDAATDGDRRSDIETTREELEGYAIVKAIMRQVVDPDRVVMRDTKSYCGIILDDNNRKPICRLHFNRDQKYLGVFDESKTEERIPLASLNDIFKHADRLTVATTYYP